MELIGDGESFVPDRVGRESQVRAPLNDDFVGAGDVGIPMRKVAMWDAVDLDAESKVWAPRIEEVPAMPAADHTLVLKRRQLQRSPDLGEIPLRQRVLSAFGVVRRLQDHAAVPAATAAIQRIADLRWRREALLDAGDDDPARPAS